MRYVVLSILLIASTGFLGVHSPAGESAVSDEEITVILERHNFWRAEVGVEPLEWSDELSEIASKWAKALKKDNCGFYHSDYGFGENLWKGTTGYFTVGDAIDSWAGEKADYNYKRNKCRQGKVCGHYTQIVWANTKKVGCAKITCNGSTTWVCEYDPPGNWVGQKPY